MKEIKPGILVMVRHDARPGEAVRGDNWGAKIFEVERQAYSYEIEELEIVSPAWAIRDSGGKGEVYVASQRVLIPIDDPDAELDTQTHESLIRVEEGG